jgi:hypothetical protein
MPKMISVNQMVRDLESMLDSWKLSDWDANFIATVSKQSEGGKDTSQLSDRQLELIDDMHKKHFRTYGE